jgi:hypothetical protein
MDPPCKGDESHRCKDLGSTVQQYRVPTEEKKKKKSKQQDDTEKLSQMKDESPDNKILFKQKQKASC